VGSKLKKLVFLSSRFPYPLNKGDKLRIFYQLKSLSKEFQIHLICVNEKKPSQDHLDAVAPFCESINCLVLPKHKRISSLISSLWKRTPLQVAYFYNKKIDRSIQKSIANIKPDYLHCHLIRTTEYVKKINNIPKSLDFMDAYASGIEKRLNIETNLFKKLLFYFEKKKLELYEAKAFEYADRYCIISNQDKDAVSNPDSKPIVIVPNGVDFEKFFPRNEDKRYDLVFMGNMTYPPNQVAVEFLQKKIMPFVLEKRPSTTLLIAGIGANSIKIEEGKNVTIVEHFEHISDSIAYSKVMVAPMLISIGLQNKIIQALAMRVPCIVSPSSNKPIGATVGQSIVEAETAQEFSKEILELLDDETKLSRIALNGYDFVKNHFSWEKQNNILTRLILS
jgi:glycosyltransferase involved in cell wall biosynthesis